MATFLAGRLAAPDWCVSSDALRARLTLEPLMDAWEVPPAHVHLDHRLYLASADVLVEIVRETPTDRRHLALVGHNPGLTDLVGLLDPRAGIDNVPTLGVVDMELNAEDWADVNAGAGRVVNFFRPREVAALQQATCAGGR